MKNYEEMSDFEINCHVARAMDLSEHLFFPSGTDDFDSDTDESDMGPVWQTSRLWVKGFRASNGNLFNPCNNVEQSWPIIVKYEIDVIQNNGQDCALATNSAVMMFRGDDVFICQHENPLRAAMIVFLKMNEDKL